MVTASPSRSKRSDLGAVGSGLRDIETGTDSFRLAHTHSTLPDTNAQDRLLFPGRTPDRPVDAAGFGKRLKRHGLGIRGGRNTALIGLAAELPAADLADLLAIDIVTATRWAAYARTDWNDYLAARADGRPQAAAPLPS